jgi:hypothetical protein
MNDQDEINRENPIHGAVIALLITLPVWAGLCVALILTLTR